MISTSVHFWKILFLNRIDMIPLRCKKPFRIFGALSVLSSSPRLPVNLPPTLPFHRLGIAKIHRPARISLFTANTNVTPRLFTKSYTNVFPEISPLVSSPSANVSHPIVGKWLLGIGGLTFGIVSIGGITRLTESGLSITEWNLVSGMKPPWTEDEWIAEFEKYKQFPEYKLLNHKLTLDEFKTIYFWEWLHRMWGRAIGLAFIFPGAYFAYRGYMTRPISLAALGIGSLIGFQGLLGWYMVKSGLSHELLETPGAVPRVSQYRLTAHLGIAFLIYGASVMTGLKILQDHKLATGTFPKSVALALQNPRLASFRRSAIATVTLIFITAISGAFVAGLDAGLIYNEFPLMGGRLVPPKTELFSTDYIKPGDSTAWRNFFENPTTVQFDHRTMAVLTFATITGHWFRARRLPLPGPARIAAHSLMAVAIAQVALGISTLLYMVPVGLAAAHQAGSLTLLTCGMWLVHALRRVPIK